MNRQTGHIRLRPSVDILHDLARIAPNADTNALEALADQESVPTYDVLSIVYTFCEEQLSIDMVDLVWKIVVDPQDHPAFSDAVRQSAQTLDESLTAFFLRHGPPPQA